MSMPSRATRSSHLVVVVKAGAYRWPLPKTTIMQGVLKLMNVSAADPAAPLLFANQQQLEQRIPPNIISTLACIHTHTHTSIQALIRTQKHALAVELSHSLSLSPTSRPLCAQPHRKHHEGNCFGFREMVRSSSGRTIHHSKRAVCSTHGSAAGPSAIILSLAFDVHERAHGFVRICWPNLYIRSPAHTVQPLATAQQIRVMRCCKRVVRAKALAQVH